MRELRQRLEKDGKLCNFEVVGGDLEIKKGLRGVFVNLLGVEN